MRIRRVAVMISALCLGFAFAGASGRFACPALAGDAQVADTLFKSGKQAFGKGDFSGAITYFTKAFDENSGLIEACWWKASAQEKAGRKPEALASYREFLQLVNLKCAEFTASKEEQRLKALAEKSVDLLAAGEKEFRKLEDAYIASLLTFAKDNFVRDPGVSKRAVDAILAERPDHEEALKLVDKLGGGGAAAPSAPKDVPSAAAGPFKSVKTWQDLLPEQWFKSMEHITYAGSLLKLDTKGGNAINPVGFIDTGTSFAFENEFNMTAVYDPDWALGLGFAAKGASSISALVLPGRVVLVQARGDGTNVDLAGANVPDVALKSWHRLGILVKGPAVEVWFDGKKAVSWREPSAAEFKGELVIAQIKCSSEWRLLRVGKVD